MWLYLVGCWLILFYAYSEVKAQPVGSIYDSIAAHIGRQLPVLFSVVAVSWDTLSSVDGVATDPWRFRRDPATSQQVNRYIQHNLLMEMQGTETAQNTANLLKNNPPRRRLSQMLRSSGYADDDVADVLMGSLLVLWQLVHQQPILPNPRGGGRIIRDSLRKAIEMKRWIFPMGDLQKQALAEAYGGVAMLIAMQLRQASQEWQSAEARQSAARADLLANILFGLQLSECRITDAGLEWINRTHRPDFTEGDP